MGAVRHELLVDRMNLVSVLTLDVVEEEQFGRAIARFNDRPLFRARRNTDMHCAHRLDLSKGTNPGQQAGKICLGIGILQPEENVVSEFGRRGRCRGHVGEKVRD